MLQSKIITLLGLLCILTGAAASAEVDMGLEGTSSIDWAQPPVGCVEEIIQQKSPYPCPDLTQVKDPTKDFPADFTEDEIALWSGSRAKALGYCRSEEIMRREELRPGSFSAVTVERAWMRVEGARDSDLKGEAIYDASEAYGIPPQILVGALMQESLMADLSISEDGNNFSCGIAQLNILEWCNWAEKLTPDLQNNLGFPTEEALQWRKAHSSPTVCRTPLLSTTLVRPFYKFGLRQLHGLPASRMRPEHLAGIQLENVISEFPAASQADQNLRFRLVRAFTQSCSHFASAIPAKANQLKILFDNEVPPAMRGIQSYAPGETYNRSCRRTFPSQAYPLHVGWLLADAIYNAGSKIVTNISYYLRLTRQTYHSPDTWAAFRGPELITSLYWAGKYNPTSDYLEFQNFSGVTEKMTFFKSCIVQRHVARVIQYATLPGFELARSAEDKNGCRKSEFNPDGTLKKSHVPLERQRSSGRK